MTELLAFTVAGLVVGSIYALAATAVVVTYATSGVLNLATGAVGMLVAFVHWQLRVPWGVPEPAALVLSVAVVAPLLGVALERLARRALLRRDEQTQVVVTIGMLIGLVGVAQLAWSPREPRSAPSLLTSGDVDVAGVAVTGDQLLGVALTVLAAGLLRAVLVRSALGIAMRAVVDDADLARTAGLRASRLASVSWALGASLAGLAGVLLAGVVALEALLLSLLVVDALAAAALGRLHALSVTFGGGLALGLATAYAVGYLPTGESWTRWKGALPALLLLAAVLVTRAGTWRHAHRRPGPLPATTPARGLTPALLAVPLGAGLAAVTAPPYWVFVLALALAWAVVALSLVPLVGWGGQLVLCPVAFAGLGALVMGHVPGPGAGRLALAAAAGAVGAALVGLVSLRLQGLQLALATLAAAVVADTVLFADPRAFPGGGLAVPRLGGAGDDVTAVVLAGVLTALLAGAARLRRGAWARRLVAARDSPLAAATLGVPVARTRLQAFALSGAVAGVGGALLAGVRTTVGAEDFSVSAGLAVVLLAAVAGVASAAGALLAGCALAALPVVADLLPGQPGAAFLGAGLAALTLGRLPSGLVPSLRAAVPRPRVAPAGSGVAGAAG